MDTLAPPGITAPSAPASGRSGPERALFFANASGQRLYGVLHPAAGGAVGGLGVVFCQPLSEERHYCQRVIVDYARQLAHGGYPTLRYDSAGCGDSEGTMVEATLATMREDARSAIARLCADTGVRGVVLVGVRFGALLASLVAGAEERVAGLVLVAPIVSGGDYWNALLRSQQMSCMTRGLKAPRLEELRHALNESGRVEIKGEHFCRAFAEALTLVDLRSAPPHCRGPLLLAAAADEPQGERGTAGLAEATRAAGSDVTLSPVPVEVFWSSKALYQGVRPHALYAATLAWLAGLAP